ncbi:MAG: hypothetical protein K5683_10440 [Prevotella sp.]|nr:hypothetical protein [Prevotella sp.]
MTCFFSFAVMKMRFNGLDYLKLLLALIMGVGCFSICLMSPQNPWIWLFDIIHLPSDDYLQHVVMTVPL